MERELSSEIWARETRSRAFGTVMIANICLFTFYMLFRRDLQPSAYFNTIFVIGVLIQAWRSIFHLTSRRMPEKRWLKVNDWGIAVYGAFWFAFSISVASVATFDDANMNAFMVIMIVGYQSASSQFFAYNQRFYYFFVFCVTIPGVWHASMFSEVPYQRILLGSLPLIYAIVQIKTRKALWEAMFRVSRTHSTLLEAINTLPVGLSVIRNDVYVMTNVYAASLIGLSQQEIYGKSLGFTKKNAEFSETIRAFEKSSEPIEGYEISVETSEGPRDHFVLLRRSTISQKETIVISLDIEERSRAERELERQKRRAEDHTMSSAHLAKEISVPLAALAEQVLVKQTPDLEKAREQIRKIQVAIYHLKAS